MLELLYFKQSLKRLFVLPSLPPPLAPSTLLTELKKLLTHLEQQYKTRAGPISLVFLSQRQLDQLATRFIPPSPSTKAAAPHRDVLAFPSSPPLVYPFGSNPARPLKPPPQKEPAAQPRPPSHLKITPSGEVLLSLKTIFSAAQAEARLLGYAFCETILHGLWHLFGLQHTYEAACLEKLYQQQAQMITLAGCRWRAIDHAFNQLVFKESPQA